MTNRRPRLLGAFAVAAAVGCHRDAPVAATQVPALADDASVADRPAPPLVGPSRCHATPWVARIPGDAGDPDLDLGDALPFGDGIAVALVHRVAGDRVAAVAFVDPDHDALPRVVDLGPTLGDAPPPRIAVGAPGGAELLASYYAAARGPSRVLAGRADASRPLAVRAVTPEGSVALFSIDEERDDSLASDLALAGDRGIVLWDEATSEPRGVIRGAPFASKQRTGPSVDLSPKDSDAESPRAVPFGKGFAVAWIARAPDPEGAAPDASDLEALGEPRTRGWVEMVFVDERGVPTVPVRRLTAPTGHVTAFDLRLATPSKAPSGPGAPLVLVAVRDDGEAVDGSGGTLLRVRVGVDVVEPPVAFTTEGLGRGAPTFVEGASSFLAWVGPGEQVRMLSLDGAGAPTGLPSAEDGMEEASPVLALPGGRVLVATPTDSSRPLQTFACGPELPSR